MRIALAQINPVVGDVAGNLQLILDAAAAARALGADVLLTPELALSGSPPADLLLRPAFVKRCSQAIGRLIDEVDDITLVVGHPRMAGTECFNCATVIRDGNVLGRYEKMLLANHGVFDEVRYFTPGAQPMVFTQGDVQIGLVISEDLNDVDVPAASRDEGAQLLLVLSASPFHVGVSEHRHTLLRQRVEENEMPAIYVNAVGGQDELVFDGQSFALNRSGSVVLQMAAFEQGLAIIDFAEDDLAPAGIISALSDEALLWQGLQTGLRDYVKQNGYEGVSAPQGQSPNDMILLALAEDAMAPHPLFAEPGPDRLLLCPVDKTAFARDAEVRDLMADYAPFKDVSATQLHQIARWRTGLGGRAGALLSATADATAPSTEQDAVLDLFLAGHLGIAEIAALGFARAEVERIVERYRSKARVRRMAPPGPRVSTTADGLDIRLPLNNHFEL